MNRFIAAAALLLLASVAAPAQPVATGCVNQATSSDPVHCDTFNAANGSFIDGKVTDDGNAVWAEGSHGGIIVNGEYTNAAGGPPYANPYAWIENTATIGGAKSPIKHLEGTFRYHIDAVGCSVAIIATTNPGAFLQKMLHAVVCTDRTEMAVAAPGYSFPTVLGVINYPRLQKDAEYKVSMDIDTASNKWTVSVAGKSLTVTHPAVSLVSPDMMVCQVGAGTPGGTAGWTSCNIGRSKASTFVAAGDALPLIDFQAYRATIPPEYAGQKSIPKPCGVFTTCAYPFTWFATYTLPSTQSGTRLKVTLVSPVTSPYLPSAAQDVREYDVQTTSTGCCGVTWGPTLTYSNPQTNQDVCVSTSLQTALYGSTLYLGAQPSVGCANAYLIDAVRVNYKIEMQGDPGGFVTPQ